MNELFRKYKEQLTHPMIGTIVRTEGVGRSRRLVVKWDFDSVETSLHARLLARHYSSRNIEDNIHAAYSDTISLTTLDHVDHYLLVLSMS